MRFKPYCIYVCMATIVVFVDQIAKLFALSLDSLPVVLIPGFFSIYLVFNTGSIFGLGASYANVLGYLGVLAIIFLPFLVKKLKFRNDVAIVLGCLAGGIAGNTWDRFLRGHVVDFLDFYVSHWHWPCFNVADIAIAGSCFYLIFLIHD